MKVWLTILAGFILLVAIYLAFSMVIGFLWWLGVGAVLLVCVVGLVRSLGPERSSGRLLGKRQEKRLDRAADRALRNIEQKLRGK